MLKNLRLNKQEAEIIRLYLSFDDKSTKYIAENRLEILKILHPLISEQVEYLIFDKKLFDLLKCFFEDEYEGLIFESYAKNMDKYNSLKLKMNFLINRMK